MTTQYFRYLTPAIEAAACVRLRGYRQQTRGPIDIYFATDKLFCNELRQITNTPSPGLWRELAAETKFSVGRPLHN